MNNLELWDKLRTPPPTALKPIVAGRLKGKSDISPQWRFQAMTETFGPVGIGWRYTIDKLWTEEGSGGQICAFALVAVYVKHNGEWSEAIPGIGGSMMVEQERNGPHTSDEAFKMATTDALSVAMKALGVAADVYLGMLDGSKYNRQPPAPPVQKPAPPPDQNAVHREHYAALKAELLAAKDADAVNAIMKNRHGWLIGMPEKGRAELNALAMERLDNLAA